jgi:hypothetical protein
VAASRPSKDDRLVHATAKARIHPIFQCGISFQSKWPGPVFPSYRLPVFPMAKACRVGKASWVSRKSPNSSKGPFGSPRHHIGGGKGRGAGMREDRLVALHYTAPHRSCAARFLRGVADSPARFLRGRHPPTLHFDGLSKGCGWGPSGGLGGVT